MVEVRIPMEPNEHEELSKTKEENDWTWKEMLYQATEGLEK